MVEVVTTYPEETEKDSMMAVAIYGCELMNDYKWLMIGREKFPFIAWSQMITDHAYLYLYTNSR